MLCGWLVLLLLITVSPLATWLESAMVSHVLLQLPLLAIVGMGLGVQLPLVVVEGINRVNRGGIFGCICISYIFLFWMIPRWLDASLTSTVVAWSKYLSIVLGGLLLYLSWGKTHFVTRGVLKIECLAMLFRLGWLYLISPARLCNSYLLSDQVSLGRGFLAIALALSVTWLIPLFWAQRQSGRAHYTIT